MKKTAVIITVFIAAAVLSGCGDKQVKPKLPVGEKVEDVPSFVMEGFKLTSTDKGRKKWVLEAKGAQVFEMKKKAYAQDVTMRSFEENGKSSVLTTDMAVINTETNFMEARQNVRVNASNGMILKTEKLFWDDKKQKMFTDEFVTIIKDKTELYGIGLESDISMQNMIIKKRVRLKAKDIQSE